MGPLEARLATAVEASGMSRVAAAHCIGVTRLTLTLWLTGGSPVGEKYQGAVRTFLGQVMSATRAGRLPVTRRTSAPAVAAILQGE